MKKYLPLLFLISGISCLAQKSVIRDHVMIDVYTYESEHKTKAGAMPKIKAKSNLMKYTGRFDYLLVNISQIHLPEKSKERDSIFNLYPEKSKIRELYLEKYVQDKKLVTYFEETMAPINIPNLEITKTYSTDELMEVASKFFYCDKVKPDTTVQSHICIGLNGVKEAKWEKDFTLLSAFCFEALFYDNEKNKSLIRESYASEKKKACEQFRKNITTLDKYLEDVRLDLFVRMKNDSSLKQALLSYYESNKNNLAFKIVK